MPTIREVIESQGFDVDDEWADVVVVTGDNAQVRVWMDSRDPGIAKAMLEEAMHLTSEPN